MICYGLLVLFYCGQPAIPAAPSAAAFCQVARPIMWSAADTRRTKEQIDSHNAAGKKICGWGRKS